MSLTFVFKLWPLHLARSCGAQTASLHWQQLQNGSGETDQELWIRSSHDWQVSKTRLCSLFVFFHEFWLFISLSKMLLRLLFDAVNCPWSAIDKSVGRWACSGSGSVLTKPYCLTLSIQWHTIVQTEIKFLSFNLTFLGNNYFFNSKNKIIKQSTSTCFLSCFRWHLGYCKDAATPTNRGFDSFYGFYGGQENYYTYTSGSYWL